MALKLTSQPEDSLKAQVNGPKKTKMQMIDHTANVGSSSFKSLRSAMVC